MPKDKISPKLSLKDRPGGVKPKPSVELGMLRGTRKGRKKNFKEFQAGFKATNRRLGLNR
jgi:hypothetical protein